MSAIPAASPPPPSLCPLRVAPAVIGGAVVYGLSRPAPVIVQQPPVYIQQPEIVVIDGISYIKQYQIINGVTTEVLIRQ